MQTSSPDGTDGIDNIDNIDNTDDSDDIDNTDDSDDKKSPGWGCFRLRLILMGGLVLSALPLLLLALATLVQFQSFADAVDGPDSVGSEVIKPIVYDRYGERLNLTYMNQWNLHDQQTLEDIPDFLQRAIILAEDKRFYQHSGPDWLARLSAGWQNVRALRVVRGASTLSEQVVRMLRPRPRTLWSRWLEGWEAGSLEQYYSKADILEFYLNQVPYSAQRRGVSQAAHYYFGRDVDTLSRKEMLALAVMLRSPVGMSPDRPNARLEKAIKLLAQRLQKEGYLAQADTQRVSEQMLVLSDVDEPLDLSHFIRYVQVQSQRSNLQDHPQAATAAIHSSLDLQLQRTVQEMLDTRLSYLKRQGAGNGAVLVVDHQHNEVLSWAVGHAGKSGPRFNRIDAVLVPRQPGSTLKPFVYALALEQGWNAATMIDDSPLQSQVGSGLHEYHNYSRQYYGLIPLREALGNSLNIPALKAVDFVGTAACLSLLRDVGITSLSAHPNIYGDGIALGNGEVSLLELVQAYATLARKGKFAPLTVLQDRSSYQINPPYKINPPYQIGQANQVESVIGASIASLIADILADATAREKEFGRHSILNFPYQTAVKTGTSSDYRDAWSVGFNDRYTVGVWMGNMDYQPMHEITGATGPAIVLRSVFHVLNKNRQVQPLSLSKDMRRIRVCRDTGQFDDGRCETRDELFTEQQRLALMGNQLKKKMGSPANVGDEPPRIRKPSHGLNIAMDPRIPDEAEYFEFELTAVDGVNRVDWYVNDQLLASSDSNKLLWQVNRGKFNTHAVVWRAGDSSPMQTKSVRYVVH